MDSFALNDLRRNQVVKDNRLIQRSRHQFTVQQQKILLYVVSQLDSQKQETFTEQTFDIGDFCRACGITVSGTNYKDLKDAVLGIKNKGFWMKLDNGSEVTVSWIAKAKIEHKSGRITICLDEDMRPYLLELSERFTKYSLIYTLTMRSKYAVRLYELLKSYEAIGKAEFGLPHFRTLIDAGYDSWGELNRRAIQPAVDEINEVSDIQVRYEGMRGRGRAFERVVFWIEATKGYDHERAIYQRLTGKKAKRGPQQVEGQLSLD